jgi:hypothetical protein
MGIPAEVREQASVEARPGDRRLCNNRPLTALPRMAAPVHGPGAAAGTEIWLTAREAGPSVPEAGPCSFCQMKEARERGSS